MLAKYKLVLSWLFLLTSAALSGGTMIAMSAYLYLAPLLPEAETYRYVQLETPLRIYTSDGRLIDEIGNRRNPVDFEDIPQRLIDALIATEDVRFYSHPGVDPQSLMRGFFHCRAIEDGNSDSRFYTYPIIIASEISFNYEFKSCF